MEKWENFGTFDEAFTEILFPVVFCLYFMLNCWIRIEIKFKLFCKVQFVIVSSSGARRCPWKIDVDVNQRIEFSVLAFGLRQFQTAQTVARRRSGGGYCAWSLVFEEGSSDVEESLCRVSGKETIFYTSTTNSVTAYLLHKQNQALPGVFLLKFKGQLRTWIYNPLLRDVFYRS